MKKFFLCIVLCFSFLSCKEKYSVKAKQLNIEWITNTIGYDRYTKVMYCPLYTVNHNTFCIPITIDGKSCKYDEWVDYLKQQQGKKIVVYSANDLE